MCCIRSWKRPYGKTWSRYTFFFSLNRKDKICYRLTNKILKITVIFSRKRTCLLEGCFSLSCYIFQYATCYSRWHLTFCFSTKKIGLLPFVLLAEQPFLTDSNRRYTYMERDDVQHELPAEIVKFPVTNSITAYLIV